MKSLVLLFLLCVGTQFGVMAQNPLALKGPEAKNYKPWKHQAKDNVIFVKAPSNSKQGPAFKNSKKWESSSVTHYFDVKSESRDIETGPKVKNRKVWKKN